MKISKDTLRVLSVLVAVALFSPAAIARENDRQSRASLTGIKGVGVVIEDLAQDAEQEGFTTALIQADAEQLLRTAE